MKLGGNELTGADDVALPRFANRGLIEAILAPGQNSRTRATSPIRESGPH